MERLSIDLLDIYRHGYSRAIEEMINKKRVMEKKDIALQPVLLRNGFFDTTYGLYFTSTDALKRKERDSLGSVKRAESKTKEGQKSELEALTAQCTKIERLEFEKDPHIYALHCTGFLMFQFALWRYKDTWRKHGLLTHENGRHLPQCVSLRLKLLVAGLRASQQRDKCLKILF